jgi:hypothetical protein
VARVDSGTGTGARREWRWDVALSFASAQRDYVEQVAQTLVSGHGPGDHPVRQQLLIRPSRRSSPSQSSQTQARPPPAPAMPPHPQPARHPLPDQRERWTQTQAPWQAWRATKLLGTMLMARHLTSYQGVSGPAMAHRQHSDQLATHATGTGHLATEVLAVKDNGANRVVTKW